MDNFQIQTGRTVTLSIDLLEEEARGVEVSWSSTGSAVGVEADPDGRSAVISGVSEGLERVDVSATKEGNPLPGFPDSVEVSVGDAQSGVSNLGLGEPA